MSQQECIRNNDEVHQRLERSRVARY